MSVIGIDFGTQSCVMAQAKRGGVEIILNEGSKRMTPALVSFQGKQRFMGEAAVPLVSSNYKNTVKLIKRLVGRSWSDPAVQRELDFVPNRTAFKELDGDKIGIEVNYQDEVVVLSPEDVCAMLIGSLKRTAEYANDGRAVSDLVFSTPNFWTDRQRRAFLAAAKIANVDVLGLINDGTAAALSYGIWKSARNQFGENKEHVMIVDMGYSSFQVTVVAFVQGKLTIVSSASDASLGGRDIDLALAKHFAAEFEAKYKEDPMKNPKAFLKLMANCEKCKQTLTPEGVAKADLNVEYLLNEIDFKSELTIEKFEEIVNPIIKGANDVLEKALSESGLTQEDIGSVEIIGGSTRVRAVKRSISEFMKLDQTKVNYGLATTQNADESISRGCALRCAMLSPAFKVKEFVVADTVRLPINVTWEQVEAQTADDEEAEEGEEKMDASTNCIQILKLGSEVPATRRVGFKRSSDFEVSASYADTVEDAFFSKDEMLIGSFKVTGIPATEDGSVNKTRVDFKLDEFGLLRIAKAEYMQPIPSEEPKEEEGEGKAAEGDAAAKEGDAEGSEEKAPEPKKIKYRAIKMNVESSFYKGLAEQDLLNSRAREEEYSSIDRVLKETSDMKNKLEAYSYSMRDKTSGELKPYGTEEELAEFGKKLEEIGDWLYDEGYDETKAVYETRYKELCKVGDKFINRLQEAEERPKAIGRLREEISANLAIVNSPDEKYEHLDEEEREKVRGICKEAEEWIDEQQKAQDDLDTFKDPILTVTVIDAKTKSVHLDCKPVVTKRKPVAPKKEETKQEDEAKTGAAESENAESSEVETGDSEKPEAKVEGEAENMDVD